jgi:hypothetical protein
MRMKSNLPARVFVIAVALLAASCSSQRATYAPDGRRGFEITCAGFLNSWSSCLVKAGRACASRGYEQLAGGEDERSMLIACK